MPTMKQTPARMGKPLEYFQRERSLLSRVEDAEKEHWNSRSDSIGAETTLVGKRA